MPTSPFRHFSLWFALLCGFAAKVHAWAPGSDSTRSRLGFQAALRICPGKSLANYLGVSHPLYRSDTRVSVGLQIGFSLAPHPHFRVFGGLGFFNYRSHELFFLKVGQIEVEGERRPIFLPHLTREYRQNFLEAPLRFEYLPGRKSKGFVLALAHTPSFWVWGRYSETFEKNVPGLYRNRDNVRMDFLANARFVFSQELQVGYILSLAQGRELDGRILASYDRIRFPSHPTRRIFLGLQLGFTWQTQKKAK